MCKYVKENYHVPADIGRRVTVDGKPGIIAKDMGHHIGVNFDDCEPGICGPCHPTWRVEYLEMGTIRKPTRAKERYQKYLELADCYDGFLDFLKCKGYLDEPPMRD